MKHLYKPLLKAYVSITNSIAFLPSFISLFFFLLSLLVLSFESGEASERLEESLSFLLVHGPENARLVLNAIITGIISLMVFSFSMVMIILSQASSNQSPRVIPGLASEKAYQVVLGFYVGTILYAFMMVLNLEPEGADERVPEMGVFVAMVLAFACLGLFVFFIHSVSRSIQVDNILERVYHEAARNLKWETKQYAHHRSDDHPPDSSGWTLFTSREEGFLTITERNRLVAFAQKHDLLIEILVKPGDFTVTHYPLLKVSRDIRHDSGLVDELYSYFIFSLSELDIGHYQYSLKQISEVAVKALSPGINDPGTAITAVHFMTMIFIRKMTCPNDRYLTDQNGDVRVIRQVYSLDQLLYKYLTPIRHYGRADVQVLLGLLDLFRLLMFQDQEKKEHQGMLRAHVLTIQEEARQNITIQRDREEVEQKIESLLQGNLIHRDEEVAKELS
jgi:uncharacterized membrane protein